MTTPIVVLDYPSAAAANDLVDTLGTSARWYKVGSELFTAEGPPFVRSLRDRGVDVFLDLKFHDIPNTVAGGVRGAAALGARLTTVHAAGGKAMVRAAVDAGKDGPASCDILVVTVLTSLSESEVAEVWGRGRDSFRMVDEVLRLADMAAEAGAHGIVCSGLEVEAVTQRFGTRLATLVPGVRLAGGDVQDQSRVVTPGTAARRGARYVVVGRAVTAASDPSAAMKAVLADLAG